MVTIAEIEAGIALGQEALPLLVSAYKALQSIWMAGNPGMTEADYIARLKTLSTDGEAFTSSWLKAHGYTQDAAGQWQKVAA